MNMTTDPPVYYVVSPAPLEHRLRAAYAAAGIAEPDVLRPVEAALRGVPTVAAVALEVTEAAIGHPDPAAWLEDALTRMARAEAAERLAAEFARHREAVLGRRRGDLVAEAAKELRPAFTRAAAALSKAAGELPQDAPLDLARIMETDATKAHRAAVTALATLGTLASIHAPKVANIGANLTRLAIVVEVPHIDHAQPIDRLTRSPLGEVDERRAQVFALDRCADREGIDVALIRVARGDWPALSLSLAGGAGELSERLERARLAVSVVVSDRSAPARTGRAAAIVRV